MKNKFIKLPCPGKASKFFETRWKLGFIFELSIIGKFLEVLSWNIFGRKSPVKSSTKNIFIRKKRYLSRTKSGSNENQGGHDAILSSLEKLVAWGTYLIQILLKNEKVFAFKNFLNRKSHESKNHWNSFVVSGSARIWILNYLV